MRIKSGHSMKSLEGMGSRSHDSGTKIRMHPLTVHRDTFSNEGKLALVVPVTSVEAEITGSKEIIALSFSMSLLVCLLKRLLRSARG